MNDKDQITDLIWPDCDFTDVYAKVKQPKKIKNQLILTCNPTGPNIFYKKFLDNETDKRRTLREA